MSAAALMVGPLAGAGFAQDGSLVDPLLDLTCKEAKETEDAELRALYIEEFCTEAEAEAAATESPLDKSVDEVTGTVDKTVKDTTDAVAGEDDTTGGGPDGGDGGEGTVVTPEETDPRSDVGTTGDGGFSSVDEGSARDGGRSQGERANPAVPGDFSYNTDGPVLPGMRSNSSLTLQPFAAPLVSVPPIYELPQIASQLFGGDSATAADPLVAGSATATGASAYSPTGYSATDPTGWLAATATGLIMLVGAAHAVTGGRLPKRSRA